MMTQHTYLLRVGFKLAIAVLERSNTTGEATALEERDKVVLFIRIYNARTTTPLPCGSLSFVEFDTVTASRIGGK
jgi:hypothetical protein